MVGWSQLLLLKGWRWRYEMYPGRFLGHLEETESVTEGVYLIFCKTSRKKVFIWIATASLLSWALTMDLYEIWCCLMAMCGSIAALNYMEIFLFTWKQQRYHTITHTSDCSVMIWYSACWVGDVGLLELINPALQIGGAVRAHHAAPHRLLSHCYHGSMWLDWDQWYDQLTTFHHILWFIFTFIKPFCTLAAGHEPK